MMYEFYLASNYVMFVMMAVYSASSSRSDVYFCIADCRPDKSNLISHVYYSFFIVISTNKVAKTNRDKRLSYNGK